MSTSNVTHPHDMPTDLVPRVSLGTLSATTPDQLLSGAAAIAKPLAKVIEDQKLYSVISGRRYVRVEGWTTLAVMLGVIAREVENTEDNGVYVAKVQLVRLADGVVISEASAECGREEPIWQKRAPYARRSMAATRATGKACRLAFSWVMTMAGFEATPAEEMDGVVIETAPAPAPKPERQVDPTEVTLIVGHAPLKKLEKNTGIAQKSGKPWTRWVAEFTDGRKQVNTFDAKLGAALEKARDEKLRCRYVVAPSQKSAEWFDLKSLELDEPQLERASMNEDALPLQEA